MLMQMPIAAVGRAALFVLAFAAGACGGGGLAPGAAAGADTAMVRAQLSQSAADCRVALPNPALAPPAGSELEFGFHAVGVQIYTCTAAAAGPAWVFSAPEADLFDRRGAVVVKHYAGPTWEALADGSKVVGARVAGATADPSAIPWLLLKAASHAGHGRMEQVAFIQRLNTTGGLAPAAGCDAGAVGAVARVPYTADYCFFEAE